MLCRLAGIIVAVVIVISGIIVVALTVAALVTMITVEGLQNVLSGDILLDVRSRKCLMYKRIGRTRIFEITLCHFFFTTFLSSILTIAAALADVDDDNDDNDQDGRIAFDFNLTLEKKSLAIVQLV